MAHIWTELLLLLNKLGLASRTELLIELVRTRLAGLLLLPELSCVRLAKLLLLDSTYLARLDGVELGGWGSHDRAELARLIQA